MTILLHRKPLRLLDNRYFEAFRAQVPYKAPTGRKHKARLMAHSGFLQSIEGSIPGTLDEVEDATVSLWPGVKSKIPEAIARLEHGPKDDH